MAAVYCERGPWRLLIDSVSPERVKGPSPEGRTPSFLVLGAQTRKASQPTGSVALPQPLVARTNKMEPDESEEANSERETERQRAINGWDRNREIEEARRQRGRLLKDIKQGRSYTEK